MKLFLPAPVLVCFFGLVVAVHAQDRIGCVLGVNRTNLSRDSDLYDYSPRTTFAIGGVLHHRLGERLALQFQPTYLQKGAYFDVNDATIGHVEFLVKLIYIEVPALFKYALRSKGSIRPLLLAGPTAGILLRAKHIATTAGQTSTTDITEGMQTLDLGLAFGGGLNFSLGKKEIFVEARYDLGLSKIQYKSSLGSYNRVIQVIMGITFPRGGN